MIVGKNSALIGFGVFLYAIITILALIGCCIAKGGFFTIVGVLNFLCNGWVIFSMYKYFSNYNNK